MRKRETAWSGNYTDQNLHLKNTWVGRTRGKQSSLLKKFGQNFQASWFPKSGSSQDSVARHKRGSSCKARMRCLKSPQGSQPSVWGRWINGEQYQQWHGQKRENIPLNIYIYNITISQYRKISCSNCRTQQTITTVIWHHISRIHMM